MKSKENRMLQWKKQYPEASLEELEKIDLKYCNEHNYRTIDFWKKKYPNKTLVELEKIRVDFINSTKKNVKGFVERENNKTCIEYWIKNNPDKTKEECEALRKSYMVEHNLCGRKGLSNGNSKLNTTTLERKSRSPYCIEFYIKKYPDLSLEECQKLKDEFHQKLKNTRKRENNKTCIEYWIKNNPDKSEEEIKKLYSEYQKSNAVTLERYVQKYGEALGKKKYDERQISWFQKLTYSFELYGDERSKQSKFAVDCIKHVCDFFKIPYPEREKYISTSEKCYAYDFCINNKIIEFNGDYWHCNPNLYEPNFYNKSKKMTAQEIWDYDANKKKIAESFGYGVLHIWESEYNDSPAETIKKCINFINESSIM